MKYLLILISVLWVSKGFVLGQGPLTFSELKSSYESGVQNVEKDFQAERNRAIAAYENEMRTLADELQKIGDLRSVIWIKKELERFAAMQVIPTEALADDPAPMREIQKAFNRSHEENTSLKAKKIGALAFGYLGKLDRLVQGYTHASKSAEAAAINTEIERVKSSTDFTHALSVINRNREEPAPKPKIEMKSAPGNVALAAKGAFALADNQGSLMIDGNVEKFDLNQGYASGRFPAKFIISLPEIYKLTKIRIRFVDSKGALYQYRISTAVDAQNWEPLVDRSAGAWSGWQDHLFPAKAVQDIRIEGLYSSVDAYVKIVEVEAYCEE